MRIDKVRKSVYGYRALEYRNMLKLVYTVLSDESRGSFFSNSITARTAQEILAPLQLPLEFVLPSYPGGLLNLDDLYKPVTELVTRAYKDTVPGLETFGYRFCTQGSSEGIQKSLAELSNSGVRYIYTIPGEYEGYKYTALGLGMNLVEVDVSQTDPSSLEPGHWYISNPSAVNGNIISGELVQRICDRHEVHLDLTYVGTTGPYVFDVSHPNIVEVFLSMSKQGMFRERIGFWFSRKMLSLMSGNTFFYSSSNAIFAVAMINQYGLHMLNWKYKTLQERIIASIHQETGIPLHASDVLILAHLSEKEASRLSAEQLEALSEFKRGNGYRICLSPWFEFAEKQSLLQN